MLYVDIPAPSDIVALATFRGEGCVSIYLRTTPVTPQAQSAPIELKNLARRAAEQLQAAGIDKRSCDAIAEQLDDLVDDNEFGASRPIAWRSLLPLRTCGRFACPTRFSRS